jgi:CheY-like chemotaxis protein
LFIEAFLQGGLGPLMPSRRDRLCYDPKVMVLIVDDDPAFLELARRRLDVGRGVLFAGTAAHARDLMRTVGSEFRVALVDLKLPVEDGFTFIRELHENVPELPVIAMTAVYGPDGLQRARAAGAFDALLKPIDDGWDSAIARARASFTS